MPMPDASLTIRRLIPASPQRVYQAWTDPALLQQFMGPPGVQASVVEMDVRDGGRYRLGMQTPGGELHVFGEYKELTPPSRIAFTWSWEHEDVRDTLVTIDLHEVPGGTELVLTHALLATQAQRDSHEHGWNGTLDRLAETTKENNA